VYALLVFPTIRLDLISVINNLKKNKIGHLKVKNYKFEKVENFKYLVVVLNEDNNNQIDLQERIKKC